MATPPIHYCHACAAARQLLNSPPIDPLATSYQLKKYAKHTVVNPTFQVQSIFNSTSTQAYADFIVDASTAGAVVVDDWDRFNIVLIAGRDVGYRFESGKLVAPTDAIQLVLTSDHGRVHAYTIQSFSVTGIPCADCGRTAIVV